MGSSCIVSGVTACGRKSGSGTPKRWSALMSTLIKYLRVLIRLVRQRSVLIALITLSVIIFSENRQHLKRANVDEIIVRGEHIGSLLATAVKSPGLPRLISGMLSLGDTNKFWRVEIPKQFVGATWRQG